MPGSSTKPVRLSDASASEWCPPNDGAPSRWGLFSVPFLLDALYGVAVAAFVLTASFTPIAFRYITGYSTVDSATIGSVPFAIALTAGFGIFTLCRIFLPEVSYRKLLESEATLLATVRGDIRHHWSRFTTRHATWHIHSLSMLQQPTRRKNETEENTNRVDMDSTATGSPVDSISSRPALVLLHGHSAGAAHWEAVLDGIGQLVDVYVLDMPGWGRSPAPPQLCVSNLSPLTMTELMVEMLEGWLNCNKLQRVILLGHSFGGFFSIHFAHAHAERVSQVIAVAPAGLVPAMPEGSVVLGAYFKWSPPQRVARMTGRIGYLLFRSLYLAFTTEDKRFPDFYYQLAAATAETGMADVAAAQFLKLVPIAGDNSVNPKRTEDQPKSTEVGAKESRKDVSHAKSQKSVTTTMTLWKQLQQLWRSDVLRTLFAILRGELLGLFWAHPCLTLLQSLDMPVSVIWGQRDEIFPPLFGPLIHRIRPHTDLYIIADALHNPAHNNARAFCAAVADCILKYSTISQGRRLRNNGKLRAVPPDALARASAYVASGTADALLLPHTPAAIVPPTYLSEFCVDDGTERNIQGGVEYNKNSSGNNGNDDRLDRIGVITNVHHGETMNTSSSGQVTPMRAVLLSRTSAGAALLSRAPSANSLAPFDLHWNEGDVNVPATPSSSRDSVGGTAFDDLPEDEASHNGLAGNSSSSSYGGESPHPWIDEWSAPRAVRPTAFMRRGIVATMSASTNKTVDMSELHGASLEESDGSETNKHTAISSSSSPADVTTTEFAQNGEREASNQLTHDGIIAALGHGRGYCNTCYHAVCLYKSYWRCACGAWSFNAAFSAKQTRIHFRAMLAFLDELYVHGTFSATTSVNIVLALRPRSELPAAHPPHAVRFMKETSASSTPRNVSNSQQPTVSFGITHNGEAKLPAGVNGCGVLPFPPLQAPFERGETFLLG